MKPPAFISPWLPHLVGVSARERWRSAAGAALGILLVGGLGLVLPAATAPLLIAPLGASAVLLFAVPASPLAQPWSILGGNGIAAVVGVTCAALLPDPSVAAAAAVGISIALLLMFRCLHPPSGAVALTAVIGGPAMRGLGYGYVIWPVLAGSLVLLGAAMAYHRLTGKTYPHVAHAPAPVVTAGARGGLGVTTADLTAAMAERDEVLPIDPDDLETVLQRAEMLAFGRRSGGVDAAAVMSHDVASVRPNTDLREVLKRLRSAGVKALPVVNDTEAVVGIVTQTDLLDKAQWGPPAADTAAARWPRLSTRADRPLRGQARDVMTSQVRCVLGATPLARVIQVMAETGHHHVPVVDEAGHLVGMITQSDVVAALFEVNRAELAV